MPRLSHRLIPKFIGMPLLFLCLLFLIVKPISAQTNNCNHAPQPNSPEIDLIIQQARQRDGAAAQVPASVLKAIYWIEGTGAYTSNPQPSMQNCQKRNPPLDTGLGWMQITDDMYNLLVPENERLIDDQGICSATDCYLSRCNPIDAIEISARVLLYKIGLWDTQNAKATGKITVKNQIYNASCFYYGGGGQGGPFDPNPITNQLANYLSFLPPDGQINYCEFVCAKSGFCSPYSAFPWPREAQSLTQAAPITSWSFNACATPQAQPITINLNFNPLRPNPFDLIAEEKQRLISNPYLAPFCAYRPTAVQNVSIDKRQPNITFSGILNTNFSSFVTPFLSGPNSTIGNRRYLADYLEGTAYYLTAPEPNNLTQVFDQLGVFRKLAPQSYQDQIKNAMIQRASGNANPAIINQTYGFSTATTQVHDYDINTPYGAFKLSKLVPKPLENPDALQIWQSSTTAKIWPYVPMFTREDTKGFIKSLPEPGQTSLPQITEVIHPHLARTYEVSSTIANMLSPESTHQFQKPDLPINWVEPAPWTTDGYWIDSSQSIPAEFGPVCDPQIPTQVISGSGDLASNQSIQTTVFKQIDNPYYNPTCANSGNILNCYLSHEYRFSPTYLKTYTPFLDQIAFNLLTGPGALFGIFNPTNEKPKNWPAAGNDSQKAPAYSFSSGQAESGLKNPGKPAQYLYNYLGTLHCEKEKLIVALQPFLDGTTYNLPPECGGPDTGGTTNPLGQWLQWPSADKSPGYYTSCYGKRCWINKDGSLHFGNHAGIDISYGSGAGIYAAALGIIHTTDFDSTFGYYVIINHQNGWYTIYGHMQPNLLVSTGDTVNTSTQIGYEDNSGKSTGSHLHFGLSQGGNTTDFFMASGLTIDPCSALPNCACYPDLYNDLGLCPI